MKNKENSLRKTEVDYTSFGFKEPYENILGMESFNG
jgi:hypothetical protein